MTLARLSVQIGEAATARLVPVLLERAEYAHRGNWRECDCSWCALKRQATERIGALRCGNRDRRADLRFYLANEYRVKLAEEFAR